MQQFFQQSTNEPPKRNVLTVARLNALIRDTLIAEELLQNIWIEGEISNLNTHTSGHCYFSLKDANSSIRCTFFAPANLRHKNLKLANGMLVQVRGSISVYFARGEYQFNVQQLVPSGEGQLRVQIEELKKKLAAEGLFAADKKRKLPTFPLTLGVATAPTGAAIQDIIRVARSRFPGISILLAPCVVQGPEAADSIIYAIELLNTPDLGVDVIIAGRGGGSFEDLLPFNNEEVARAFASSRVPIVSAVGHEIDHPLSDLAADMYAATPSAAVQKVIPIISEVETRIEECAVRMRYSLQLSHRRGQERLHRVLKSRVHIRPRAMLEEAAMQLDSLEKDLSSGMHAMLATSAQKCDAFKHLDTIYENSLNHFKEGFTVQAERLANFSPLGTLARGYSVVRNKKARVIRKMSDVVEGEEIEILLSEGRLEAKVTKKIKP